jgi:hypothetical protein
MQGGGSGSALFFKAEYGSGIRIRVKTWIRIQICIEINIQKLYRLKTEPSRAVDTHNGGVEAHNGALESL